jgi:type I restriction enzyme S subunit
MADLMINKSIGGVSLGQLPPGWQLRTIGELAVQVGSGVTPRGGRETYLSEGVPLIRSQNVLMNRLNLEDVAFISHETHESMKRSAIAPGDVLLNITGASIGRVTVVPNWLALANVNQHVCKIRLNHQADPYFVSYYLSTDAGQASIVGSQYGTTRQGLNYGQVRQLQVLLPPLAGQRAIALALRTAQRAKEYAENLVAAKKDLFDALLNDLMTGKLPATALQLADSAENP